MKRKPIILAVVLVVAVVVLLVPFRSEIYVWVAYEKETDGLVYLQKRALRGFAMPIVPSSTAGRSSSTVPAVQAASTALVRYHVSGIVWRILACGSLVHFARNRSKTSDERSQAH